MHETYDEPLVKILAAVIAVSTGKPADARAAAIAALAPLQKQRKPGRRRQTDLNGGAPCPPAIPPPPKEVEWAGTPS